MRGKELVMRVIKYAVCMACTGTLLFASCATSPEAEQRRLDQQASIAEILSQSLDDPEYGAPRRCLADSQFIGW